MLSDPGVQAALKALSGATQSFHASLATTLEQVRLYAAVAAPTHVQIDRFAAELGEFAGGRINLERFSALFGGSRAVDPTVVEALEKAAQTLAELAARGDDLFAVDVAPGACLRGAVARATERIGRVFAAARVVEQCQSAAAGLPAQQAGALEGFPFRSWSRLQRLLAPPLVVRAAGGDLYAGGLAEFLDGTQKIALVVRGDCPPAPLARLIAAGTFVMQTADAASLARLAAVKGPGAAALVPAAAAQFVHDPGASGEDRMRVLHVPDAKSIKPIGGMSVFQQAEDLQQLRFLAEKLAPARPDEAAAPAARADDAVEKLAGWLISQAELE